MTVQRDTPLKKYGRAFHTTPGRNLQYSKICNRIIITQGNIAKKDTVIILMKFL